MGAWARATRSSSLWKPGLVETPVIYEEGLTDSRRWATFDFRPGDIVISVPSKCGTTWLQMMCALLIFGPKLPSPLTYLSPWLDMRLQPASEIYGRLAGQQHRRFIKTHTPLDGLPAHEGVTYVVMGRDPRDVAVSMSHHRANLDAETIGTKLGNRTLPASEVPLALTGDRVRADALTWFYADDPVPHALSSLKGMTWHLGQAWHRRSEPNVVVLHYQEVAADPEGTMKALSNRLGIAVNAKTWPDLVSAARFESMRAGAQTVIPDEGMGLIKNPAGFFNVGKSGQWADILTPCDLDHYAARVSALVDDDVNKWLHQA